MEKKEKLPVRYFYPAVFNYEDKEISVVFPNLNCATSGVDEEDALISARECLGAYLATMEELGETIPTASHLSEVHTEEGESAILVDVYMPSIRMANQTKAVNRTVTLPAWLNAIAQEHNVNFSQVLQEALKERFAQ